MKSRRICMFIIKRLFVISVVVGILCIIMVLVFFIEFFWWVFLMNDIRLENILLFICDCRYYDGI